MIEKKLHYSLISIYYLLIDNLLVYQKMIKWTIQLSQKLVNLRKIFIN
jgi:hypothetical protein